MFSDVENISFYIFVGAPAEPDPRRAPGGPRPPQFLTKAQGRAQGLGEGPGESATRAQGPRRAPAQGRAPLGPMAPQGPCRAQGRAPPGPRARCAREARASL